MPGERTPYTETVSKVGKPNDKNIGGDLYPKKVMIYKGGWVATFGTGMCLNGRRRMKLKRENHDPVITRVGGE